MKVTEIAKRTKFTVEKVEETCQMARTFCMRAYCPYSKYKVGVGLLTSDGKIFGGCNVENASYGLCICAERTAIVKAVSEGEVNFSLIAVHAPDGSGGAAPCGACRQFIIEFNPEMIVIGVPTGKDDEYRVWTAKELLPAFFGPSNLE